MECYHGNGWLCFDGTVLLCSMALHITTAMTWHGRTWHGMVVPGKEPPQESGSWTWLQPTQSLVRFALVSSTPHTYAVVGWLVGWLVLWLVGLLAGRLVGWRVGCRSMR
jgi:hypothetical protein